MTRCPLFNLAGAPFLHELDSSRFGYSINGKAIAAMAYADDILFVAASYGELARNLDIAEIHFKNIGLALNPLKTQYFGWRFNSHRLKWFD